MVIGITSWGRGFEKAAWWVRVVDILEVEEHVLLLLLLVEWPNVAWVVLACGETVAHHVEVGWLFLLLVNHLVDVWSLPFLESWLGESWGEVVVLFSWEGEECHGIEVLMKELALNFKRFLVWVFIITVIKVNDGVCDLLEDEVFLLTFLGSLVEVLSIKWSGAEDGRASLVVLLTDI